jgi:hypothetical protein
MKRVVFVVLILLWPVSLCAFWPLYWELDGQKNILGPLISYDNRDDETHVTVRPLLSSYDSPRTYSFLFPLGKSTEESAYLIPIYSRHKTSEEKYDVSLFPFFYGRDGERSYGGVFPFYGKLYHRFRRDEIGFVLWPLYAYNTGDRTTRTDVLFPFFSFYSGYQEGYKIWPLYGQRHWGEERRSMFVLWPFFIKDERGLDTDQTQNSTFVVPFYMHSESPVSEYTGVLWPFFTYKRVRDRVEVNAPWPFFSYSSGETEQQKSLTFWPVYSKSKSERDEVTYVMWPIYKAAERYAGDAKWTEKRILLLNKYVVDDRGRFLNIWPFFEYRAKDEKTTFYFPSILPWRNKGFDRIVRPLITLYEYRRDGDKTVSNTLYGLYTKEQNGTAWKRRFAFLFEMKRDEKGTGFQILSGLFGVDSEKVKILFVPIKREEKKVTEERQGSEAGDRTSDVGDQESEVRGQTSGIEDNPTEVGDQISEILEQRPEVGDQTSEIGERDSENFGAAL